ncbi:TPA: hypothetical protein VEO38_003240 [Providencia alcalifaciens]|nr:hypothetical protein [Providencia alcalifaciens]
MINLKNVLLKLFIQQEENSLHNKQEMDEPRFSDCLNSYESETMMIEQMAVLDSTDGSSVDNNLLSAFETKTINCEIILGDLYCW